MQRGKIGLREVRGLQHGAVIWDSSVIGFGARRQVATPFHMYRTQDGRQRWMTIGRHGSPWTPDTARNRAREILGAVVAGADPSGEKIGKRKALTVADLCDQYFEDAVAGREYAEQSGKESKHSRGGPGSDRSAHKTPSWGDWGRCDHAPGRGRIPSRRRER
jgi:hypothetical protein